MCGHTAEELFYKTRSTSGSISTLLWVLILPRSFSTRQGARVGVYLSCSVCSYFKGALLQDKEHQWEYTYPVECGNTAEEHFYKTRSSSGSISTLLCVEIPQRSSSTRQGAPVGVYLPCCVLILQRSSSTRQGALVGVYLPCCVWSYCRGALLQDKEHQ